MQLFLWLISVIGIVLCQWKINNDYNPIANEDAIIYSSDTNGKDIPVNFTDLNYMMVLEDIIMAPVEEPINTSNDSYDHGFDFWWIDWQQGGETGIYYSNMNPTLLLNYVRATDNMRKQYNKRGHVLSRYGGLGNQRYPHGFSGDVKPSWISLAFQPYFTSTASNVAYGWSHDLDRGVTGEYELQTRWIQWGAYSPMYRTHGPGGRSTPDIWRHQWNYFQIERDYVQQRQELLPYLYNLTYNLYVNNIHLLRPMYYDFVAYPSDIEFNWIYNQYMFGDYMLISPVTNYSGDSNGFNLTLQTLWLPPNSYWYEKHSGYLFYYESSKDLEEGKVISRWMDITETPIYIQCTKNTIIPIQPFDSNYIIGKAGLKYYESLRFDIYITPNYYTPNNNLYGENKLYEDDGYSMDYLQNKNVWTYIIWEFDIKTFVFNANITTEGNYNGFEYIVNNGRYYSLRIYNVFPPKNDGNVYCNGNRLKYDKLVFLQNKIGSNGMNDLYGKYYYDGKTMSLTINCYKTINVYNVTNIQINFADSWVNDINMLNGMRGMVNRAYLAKRNLDEGTVSQSVPENNLTVAASYMSLLGEIGDDYHKFKSKINEFNDIYNNAIKETKKLNPNTFSDGQQRLNYSVNLLTTITQTY